MPDFGNAKAAKFIAEAKKRCTDEPHIIPSVITQETYSSADRETLVALPKEASFKAILRRLKRKNNPQLPTTLDIMGNLPDIYLSVDNENWLIHDSGVGEGRCLLLGRASVLLQMARSRM